MSIVATNLALFGCQNGHGVDDVTPVGGGIAPHRRILGAVPGPGLLTAVSDGEDDRSVSVWVRRGSGILAQLGPTSLDGESPVTLGELAADDYAVRPETGTTSGARAIAFLVDDFTYHVIEPDEIDAQGLFLGAGPGQARYEKLFARNTSADAAWDDAEIVLLDPGGDVDAIALESVLNGDNAAPNRLTEPTGITDWGTAVPVPGDTVGPGDAIGVWFRQVRASGALGIFAPRLIIRMQGD